MFFCMPDYSCGHLWIEGGIDADNYELNLSFYEFLKDACARNGIKSKFQFWPRYFCYYSSGNPELLALTAVTHLVEGTVTAEEKVKDIMIDIS